MARMRTKHKNKYPRLAGFVPNALKTFHQDEHKMSLFLKYSNLSPAPAEKALAHFITNPWIKISDIGLGPFGTPALGKFDTDFKNTIFWLKTWPCNLKWTFRCLKRRN